MSEKEVKLLLALTSNIRLGVLMLDRANDLKEMELNFKYPEHQKYITDRYFENKRDEMLKETQLFTLKGFEKQRKEENNGRSS